MRHKRHDFYPWVGKIPWNRKLQTHSSISCLENSMDRGAWRSTVHGDAKHRTRLSVHRWWWWHYSLIVFTTWSTYPMEKEMATHSSIPAWRALWTEEPGGLLPVGSHRVGHWSDLACMHAWEKEMATHSSIPAWRTLWTEEPGGLLPVGSHRVGHWSDLACMHAWEKEMATHCSVIDWRIPGTEEPGGLPSIGSHRVGHDWSSLQQQQPLTLNCWN